MAFNFNLTCVPRRLLIAGLPHFDSWTLAVSLRRREWTNRGMDFGGQLEECNLLVLARQREWGRKARLPEPPAPVSYSPFRKSHLCLADEETKEQRNGGVRTEPRELVPGPKV